MSNWLLRLAWDCCFADVDSFLRCTAPPDAYAVYRRFRRQIDSFVPSVFLNHLGDLTGLPVERFSQMTLAHWVPCLAVSGHASGQLFREYIRGFRAIRGVPQPKCMPGSSTFSPYVPVYPWGNLGVYNEPLVCQRCLSSRANIKRTWTGLLPGRRSVSSGNPCAAFGGLVLVDGVTPEPSCSSVWRRGYWDVVVSILAGLD